MSKFRVVEMRPGVFAVQKTFLWWWTYIVDGCAEFPVEFCTAEAAARKMREWEAIDNHIVRVVE